MKGERTQAQRAVAHARQVATHPWSDAEIVASLYDEGPGLETAVSHSTEVTRANTAEQYVRVLYKDGSQAWASWDKNGNLHFHTRRGYCPAYIPLAPKGTSVAMADKHPVYDERTSLYCVSTMDGTNEVVFAWASSKTLAFAIKRILDGATPPAASDVRVYERINTNDGDCYREME